MDPVWSERCSPSQHVGPRRLHAVPVPLSGLGRVDAVVISHDHYDHLDMDTIRALVSTTHAVFLVPRAWGRTSTPGACHRRGSSSATGRRGHDVRGVRVTAVEAQHFSGRGLRRDGTLWASWVLAGRAGKVFFSGDSGSFDGYARLGAEHGPFALSLMAVGAYGTRRGRHPPRPRGGRRGDIAAARRAARADPLVHVRARPAPVGRAGRAAARRGRVTRGVPLAVPRVGERVDPTEPPGLEPWWELQRADGTPATR